MYVTKSAKNIVKKKILFNILNITTDYCNARAVIIYIDGKYPIQ